MKTSRKLIDALLKVKKDDFESKGGGAGKKSSFAVNHLIFFLFIYDCGGDAPDMTQISKRLGISHAMAGKIAKRFQGIYTTVVPELKGPRTIGVVLLPKGKKLVEDFLKDID